MFTIILNIVANFSEECNSFGKIKREAKAASPLMLNLPDSVLSLGSLTDS